MARNRDAVHGARRNRLIRERNHDPYKSGLKMPEPTRCPECNAVFEGGRWVWGTAPADANEALCPACRRIRERVPAGFLSISGDFFKEHREEILNLIHNVEQRQKEQRPMERIMAESAVDGGLELQFTDPHLTRAVTEALHHAYGGDADFKYADEDVLLRAHWHRG